MIAATVMSALKLRDEGASRRSTSCRERLQTRTALIILDNCEHLLSGSGRDS